jgi:hypothetical protein
LPASLMYFCSGKSMHFSSGVDTWTVRLAVHERGLIENAAMRASATVCPNPCLKPFAGLVFVGKDRVEKIGVHESLL